jgi:glutamate synthase (NADPH/NADH) small chain
MLRTSSSHEEGVERKFSVMTKEFVCEDGRVSGITCTEVKFEGGKLDPVPGTEFTIEADLVLLAMGFVHPEKPGVVEQLGVELDGRGNIKIDQNTFSTTVPGVYAAGDCQRGQSLIVWGSLTGARPPAGLTNISWRPPRCPGGTSRIRASTPESAADGGK